MYNKKTLAVIGMTALMLVTMAGCGSKNNSAAEVNTTTATTAAPVKVENETKKSVTEATTEATTEAVTEAVTEAQTETQEAASEEATEAVTEAPAEVVETPTEAPAEPVIEAPEPVVVEGSAPPSGQPAEPVESPEPITNAGSLTVLNTKVDEKGVKKLYDGASIDISKVNIPEGVTYIYTSNAAGHLYEFYYGDVRVTGTRKYWAYSEEEVYGQINRALASRMQRLRETGKIK